MRIKHYPGARIKPEPSQSMGKQETTVAPLIIRGISDESDRWRLGGCPRCHGDVFLDSEDGQVLGHCLQCGYVGARIVAPAPVPVPENA
jgi:hypothetical protein